MSWSQGNKPTNKTTYNLQSALFMAIIQYIKQLRRVVSDFTGALRQGMISHRLLLSLWSVLAFFFGSNHLPFWHKSLGWSHNVSINLQKEKTEFLRWMEDQFIYADILFTFMAQLFSRNCTLWYSSLSRVSQVFNSQ